MAKQRHRAEKLTKGQREFGTAVYSISSALGHLWTRVEDASRLMQELAIGEISRRAWGIHPPDLPPEIMSPHIVAFRDGSATWKWEVREGGVRWLFMVELFSEGRVELAATYDPSPGWPSPDWKRGVTFLLSVDEEGYLSHEVLEGDLLPGDKPQLLGFAEGLKKALDRGTGSAESIIPSLIYLLKEVASTIPEPSP